MKLKLKLPPRPALPSDAAPVEIGRVQASGQSAPAVTPGAPPLALVQRTASAPAYTEPAAGGAIGSKRKRPDDGDDAGEGKVAKLQEKERSRLAREADRQHAKVCVHALQARCMGAAMSTYGCMHAGCALA